MRTRASLSTAVLALLGTAVVTAGAAGASGAAAPTTTVPAPPPTCTCPPATTAVPAPPAAPTTAAGAPTTAPVPTTAAAGVTVATTAAPAATGATAAPTPGAGLPANATLDQLVAAIQPMFGPTTDVMGEFAIFGITPPAGVPTPVGAEIHEFQIDFDDLVRDEPYYRGVAVLTSTQPAAEMVTLFQTELVAAGYTQTGDSVENTDSGRQIRWLDYDIAGATHFMSELSIGVIDDDVDFVQIEWYSGLDPAATASATAAFSSWTSLPLVDQTDALERATIGNYISGDRLQIDTSYHVAIPHAEVEAQFLAGLQGGPFTVDQEASEPGSWASLEGGGFDDLTVHFTENSTDGTTTLNVSSYVQL